MCNAIIICIQGGEEMHKGYQDRTSDMCNLIAAGCSNQFIRKYNEIKANQKLRFQMLYEHRDFLLKKIHKEQRKLDCLDFFIRKEKGDLK